MGKVCPITYYTLLCVTLFPMVVSMITRDQWGHLSFEFELACLHFEGVLVSPRLRAMAAMACIYGNTKSVCHNNRRARNGC
jgi:hypothetical protein